MRWLVAIALIAALPRLALAQGTSEDPYEQPEDPNPLTLPPPVGSGGKALTGDGGARSYTCFAAAADVLCADDVRVGERLRASAGAEPRIFTFALATHETVRLETRGALDTRGALFDADGRRMAADDDGGRERNFRIVRTLAPGSYFLAVASVDGNAGDAATYELRTAAATPLGWTGVAGRDVGNHCGRARAVAASGAVDGRFERSGDVDVFALELAQPGELAVAVEGPARYELKAADCVTSIGLADGSLGSTRTPLDAGTYFLYVSPPLRDAGDYRLRLELP